MARAASDLPICLLHTQQPFASRGSYIGCWLAPDWHSGLFRVGCFPAMPGCLSLPGSWPDAVVGEIGWIKME